VEEASRRGRFTEARLAATINKRSITLHVLLNVNPPSTPTSMTTEAGEDGEARSHALPPHGRVIDRGNDFYDKMESKSRRGDLTRTSLNSVKAENR